MNAIRVRPVASRWRIASAAPVALSMFTERSPGAHRSISTSGRPVAASASIVSETDEAGHRDRVGRVRAHLAQHVVVRPDREQRRHDAALAARVLDAMQHVREERAGRKAVVLAMQQEGEPADARPQLRGIVAEPLRDLDDARTRGFGKARLVFSARETVPIETSAARATSRMVVPIVRGPVCLG